MKYIAYAIGFIAAVGCIVFPIVTHAATHMLVAMIIFGLALGVAMALMVAWNKSGAVTAGAGDADLGLSASFDLDTGQWVIVFAIIAVGLIGAIIAAAVIHH